MKILLLINNFTELTVRSILERQCNIIIHTDTPGVPYVIEKILEVDAVAVDVSLQTLPKPEVLLAKYLAKVLGKELLYFRNGQPALADRDKIAKLELIEKASTAVLFVTGAYPQEYLRVNTKYDWQITNKRLFIRTCWKLGLTEKDIARYIHQDRTTVAYNLKKSKDEIRYYPKFKELDDSVQKMLLEV